MANFALSPKISKRLEGVEGEKIGDKIVNLLKTNALLRLRECNEKIFMFESTYGMDWEKFKNNWVRGDIKNKYSHKIERDFMEWEGFEKERRNWLETLHEIKEY